MGRGSYSLYSASSRASSYDGMSMDEVFTTQGMKTELNPVNIGIREARDSEEHPESFPIIIGLDVTGSMGSVPNFLIREGLVNIMEKLFEHGVDHTQILFLAIGDHLTDSAPLQVGQFESSDELIDKWLKEIFIEGRGGGNNGESYGLAWYFAGFHTVTDSFEKRGKKGLLITIGDEPVHREISNAHIRRITGSADYNVQLVSDMLEEARKTYNVYHLHIGQTRQGSRQETINDWKELMDDDLIVVSDKEDVANKIVDLVKRQFPSNLSNSKTESTNIEELVL